MNIKRSCVTCVSVIVCDYCFTVLCYVCAYLNLSFRNIPYCLRLTPSDGGVSAFLSPCDSETSRTRSSLRSFRTAGAAPLCAGFAPPTAFEFPAGTTLLGFLTAPASDSISTSSQQVAYRTPSCSALPCSLQNKTLAASTLMNTKLTHLQEN